MAVCRYRLIHWLTHFFLHPLMGFACAFLQTSTSRCLSFGLCITGMTRSSSYLPILLGATSLAVVATILQQQQRKSKDNQSSSSTTTTKTTSDIPDDVAEKASTPSAQQRLTLEDKAYQASESSSNSNNNTDRQKPKQIQEESISFSFHPIGTVHSVYRLCVGTPRQGLLAPHARGQIELTALHLDAVAGLEGFSHIWVIFCFHLNTLPKNESKQPSKVAPPALGGVKVGVLATRSPHRPNPIGMTLCKLDGIRTPKIKQQLVTILDVSGLDLVDGTPVLDIKPFVPQYDTSDGNIGHNTTLPSWVVGGLETRRRVTISTLAKEQLLAILQKNPKALLFYGPHRGDLSTDETFHQVTKCIEEVLSIDVRSSWQTQKARKGKSQAERANRVKEVMVSGGSGDAHDEANHLFHVEDEEDICTQQIDNLLLHFTVVEHQTEQQRSTSKGSGAEDSVHVKSIRFIGSVDQQVAVENEEAVESKTIESVNLQVPCESRTNKELDVPEKPETHPTVNTTEEPSSVDTATQVSSTPSAEQQDSVAVDDTKPLAHPATKHNPEQIEDASYKRLKSYWSKQASQNTPTGLVPVNPVERVASKEKFFVFSDKPIRVKIGMGANRSGSASPPPNTTSGNVTPPMSNLSTTNENSAAAVVTTTETDNVVKPVEKESKLEESAVEVAKNPMVATSTDNNDATNRESEVHEPTPLPASESKDPSTENMQGSERIESSDVEKPLESNEDVVTASIPSAIDGASPSTTATIASSAQSADDAPDTTQKKAVSVQPVAQNEEMEIEQQSESMENTTASAAVQPYGEEPSAPASRPLIENATDVCGQPLNPAITLIEQLVDEPSINEESSAPRESSSSSLIVEAVVDREPQHKAVAATSEERLMDAGTATNTGDVAIQHEVSAEEKHSDSAQPQDRQAAATDEFSPSVLETAAVEQEVTETTLPTEGSTSPEMSQQDGVEQTDDETNPGEVQQGSVETDIRVKEMLSDDNTNTVKVETAEANGDTQIVDVADIAPKPSDAIISNEPQVNGVKEMVELPLEALDSNEPTTVAVEAGNAEVVIGHSEGDVRTEGGELGAETSVLVASDDAGVVADAVQNTSVDMIEDPVSTQTPNPESSQTLEPAPVDTTSDLKETATTKVAADGPAEEVEIGDLPTVESSASDAEVKEESNSPVLLVSASEETADHDEEDPPVDASGDPMPSSNSQAKKRRKRKKNKK